MYISRSAIDTLQHLPMTMDKKTLSDRLKNLAANDGKRSKAARMRDVIGDIEMALASGVSQKTVYEEVKLHIDMPFQTFIGTLRRIREKQARHQDQATIGDPPRKPASKPESVNAEPAKVTPQEASHNPTDIDKIMGSNPDLQQLAKLGKHGKGKK